MSSKLDSAWTLSSGEARLEERALRATIDPANPQRGLVAPAIHSRPIEGRLLSISRAEPASATGANASQDSAASDWPLPLAETYVRGGDLVASYNASEEWPYAPQIYWSAGVLNDSQGAAASIAILLSVQTHLLDTYPCIQIVTELPSAEICSVRSIAEPRPEVVPIPPGPNMAMAPGVEPCCVLWRPAGEAWSYAEVMQASDFRQVELQHAPTPSASGGKCCVRWHCFADFLEKGVIRRARLFGFSLPRENDAALAAACCRSLDQLPLPLTA